MEHPCGVCGVEGERFIFDEWLCARHAEETVKVLEAATSMETRDTSFHGESRDTNNRWW